MIIFISDESSFIDSKYQLQYDDLCFIYNNYKLFHKIKANTIYIGQDGKYINSLNKEVEPSLDELKALSMRFASIYSYIRYFRLDNLTNNFKKSRKNKDKIDEMTSIKNALYKFTYEEIENFLINADLEIDKLICDCIESTMGKRYLFLHKDAIYFLINYSKSLFISYFHYKYSSFKYSQYIIYGYIFHFVINWACKYTIEDRDKDKEILSKPIIKAIFRRFIENINSSDIDSAIQNDLNNFDKIKNKELNIKDYLCM
jgi:hypothetical protein